MIDQEGAHYPWVERAGPGRGFCRGLTSETGHVSISSQVKLIISLLFFLLLFKRSLMVSDCISFCCGFGERIGMGEDCSLPALLGCPQGAQDLQVEECL